MIRSLVSLSSRTILTRNFFPAAASPRPLSQNTHRFLDTDANQKAYDDFLSDLSPARRKMVNILNDYRSKNFTQCTNTRFFKHIISAVDTNKDEMISKEEYETMLKNIGAEEQMTKKDMDDLFDELGVGDEKLIPVDTIKKSWEPLLRVVMPTSV